VGSEFWLWPSLRGGVGAEIGVWELSFIFVFLLCHCEGFSPKQSKHGE